jgi:hypothetical protein
LTNQISTDLSWLQKHEKLIVALAILAVLGALGNKWIDYVAAKDKISAQQAQAVLAAQASKNAELAGQLQTQASQYQKLVSDLTAQNAKLASAIAARDAATKTQQQTDATLPLGDLAARWQTLVSLPVGSVTPNATGVSVSEQGARQTTQELEKVPGLEADLTDEQETNANLGTQIATQTALTDTQKQLISGLQTQLTDAQTACKKEITAAKAEGRKHLKFWATVAYGAGLVTRLILVGKL